MNLNQLQRNWDEFGKTDPLWAILSDPSRRGGKWDLEEFFAQGRQEIAGIMQRAQTLGCPAQRRAALDFGCGVGRITQALAAWFEISSGVDIAPSMIELARRYNQHDGKCDYYVNADRDLQRFADNSFDFIYSKLVLQHMEPRYSTSYIREFVRVLRPGGLLMFQIPDRRRAAPFLETVSCVRLPDGGFRARLTGPATIQAVAGSQFSVPVTIQNVGACAWPRRGDCRQNYMVKLGNHWLSPQGEQVVWDDGRQALPYDLLPHAEIQTAINVTAPLSAGKYILELDMVQEGVAWFKQKSSNPARVPAEIQPAPAPAGGAMAGAPPRMEAYGVEKDKVIELLISSSAKVLDTVADTSAGPEWTSFQYFATKL